MNKVTLVPAYFKDIMELKKVSEYTGEKVRGFFGDKYQTINGSIPTKVPNAP